MRRWSKERLSKLQNTILNELYSESIDQNVPCCHKYLKCGIASSYYGEIDYYSGVGSYYRDSEKVDRSGAIYVSISRSLRNLAKKKLIILYLTKRSNQISGVKLTRKGKSVVE